MTVSAWPPEVPQTFLVAGYVSPVPSAAVYSTMDAGSLKSRRRWTAPPREQTGVIPMTAAQLAAFEAWYRENLSSGTQPFSMVHPTSGQTAAWLFAEAPVPRPDGYGGRWLVSVRLVSVPSILIAEIVGLDRP